MLPKKPATRRYVVRLAVLMGLYFILLVGAIRLFRQDPPEGMLAYVVAIAPALPVIGVFWAVMRLIVEETDEFIRLLHVRQFMVATGFCLTVVTVWQFLQNFDLAPPGNEGFGALFFWFLGLGVGGLYNRLTMGTAGGCR